MGHGTASGQRRGKRAGAGAGAQDECRWFKRGDQRINRDGRPRKAWVAYADRAPRADRLMLVWVPRQDFGHRLTGDGAPCIANLPADFEVVGSRVDLARNALAVIVRSGTFPRIAKGAPIPEFKPQAVPPADRAPRDDELMVLWLPGKDLIHRLSQQNAPWIVNLSAGCQIVGSRVDPARDAVALILRSAAFDRIPKGTPIPELQPEFHGLKWRRRG
jgi:hypothetical protein